MKNLVRLMTITAFVGAAFTAVYAGGNKLEARMNSGELAEAKAKFESRGDRDRLSVEVQGTANAHVGGKVRIEIGAFSATVMFDAVANNFDLNLDSQDGDTVPSISSGDAISVFDDATDDLLLSGTFTAK